MIYVEIRREDGLGGNSCMCVTTRGKTGGSNFSEQQLQVPKFLLERQPAVRKLSRWVVQHIHHPLRFGYNGVFSKHAPTLARFPQILLHSRVADGLILATGSRGRSNGEECMALRSQRASNIALKTECSILNYYHCTRKLSRDARSKKIARGSG